MKIKIEKSKKTIKREEREVRKEARKTKQKNKESFDLQDLYQLINDRFDEIEEKLGK